MKFSLIVLCAAIGALQATPDNRIINGEEAYDGQFPYIVSIRNVQEVMHICGASILDESTILTAAHCVYGVSPYVMTVIAGTISPDLGGGQERQVSYYTIHEYYNPSNLDNDIAIIKLETPLTIGPNVQPVLLPIDSIVGNMNVILSGWGMTSYPVGQSPEILQFMYMRTVELDECRKRHSTKVLDSHVCTFIADGQGVCHGDSGGPLVDTYGYQVGIVSWAIPCAVGYPDVFTRVYSFLDWIQTHRY
ncbi:PREDICTED: chymotrypsin-2-like [Nicrophorus vespilloides]|uniref:Chymotrypsin-2-like n=1 Tax=Nicrophorus vespilloides TaxID=110193 RepID=A0ABM1MNQ9_NICVS|nr:PREDICTED: chymotrypsin-2-like [Nicrophorus vespilloides]